MSESHPVPTKGPHKTGLSPDTWKLYVENASKEEEEFFKAWNMEMDTLLLFATLFSAVLTTFVVESYQSLKEDPGTTAAQALQQILLTLQTNGTGGQVQPNLTAQQPFEPTRSAVRVNSYWFAALVVSVSTAFLAILAKQWLFSLTKGLVATREMMGRQQQFRHDNLRKWNLVPILSSLPILLHISLLLFFAGLIEFLWPINRTVAIVAASLASATVSIYAVTHALSLIRLTCPYRTSVTSAILAGINAVLREVLTYWWSLQKVLGLRVIMLIQSYVNTLSPEGLEVYYYTVKALGYPGRWRRKNKVWWTQKLTKVFTSRYWEEKYISSNADLVDAKAMARLIEKFPHAEGIHGSLARELVSFRALVSQRDTLIEAGAIGLLARQIRSLYAGPLDSLSKDDRTMIILQSNALARMITETDDRDPRSTVLIKGIPLPIDPAIATNVLYGEDGVSSLTTSGLCSPDAALVDTGDLMFFAHMLRVHLVVSTDSWYSRGIHDSVTEFYRRLRDAYELANLQDDDLIALVNTAMYVAMRPIRTKDNSPREWNENDWQKDNTAQTLDALSAIMLHRPDMGHAVRRQICWGIWRCSKRIPETYIQFGSLIPIIATTERLSDPLANFLSSDASSPSLQHSVLILLEGLLHPVLDVPDIGESERQDREQLLQALKVRYPNFLQELRDNLALWSNHGPSFLRLLKLIVEISLILASNDPIDSVRERVTSSTLSLLARITQHSLSTEASQSEGSTPSTDEKTPAVSMLDLPSLEANPTPSSSVWGDYSEDIRRLAYGAASQIALRQALPPTGGRDNLLGSDVTFDEWTPEKIAQAFISVLQAASDAVVHPNSLQTILSMIASLPHSRDDRGVGYMNSAILTHLRGSTSDISENLLRLSRIDKYSGSARDALIAIQQDDQGYLLT